jgi:hypothetical protein
MIFFFFLVPTRQRGNAYRTTPAVLDELSNWGLPPAN